jgi:hypothetical protein
MRAFGKSFAYAVQGRKVDEILQFLHKEHDYTFIKDENDFSKVIQSLKRKVDELNNKYPKTQQYHVEVEKSEYEGHIRIHASGYTMRGIGITYWNVREYNKKGGEQ